ncbi:WD-repeat protein, putative [Entamoeba invadens IP1]|uniref:WD-repeat protein, putative n=1 Tax=Entamoeba invadens IP1 TaxID=370355 RepID=UPI0002C3F209|nr:WD-repeat protein, putative [Entamoeba invadens IP1]ELP93400.1 WD-repeat protein, putative [Entamoeba invadens IP1]|eukprot:XP_004260171.1 WD-repeat protein, putative [Entamoeba invadens IP1]
MGDTTVEDHSADVPTTPIILKTNAGTERFADLLNDILKEYNLLYEENKALIAQLEALKVQPNVRNVKFYQSETIDTKKPKTTKNVYSHYVSKKTTAHWKFLHSYLSHRDCVFDIACCPWDVSTFATASSDRSARISTAQSGKCLQFFPHPRPVTSVAFHPSEHIMATACGDGIARIYKVGNLNEEDMKEEQPVVEQKVGEIAIGVSFNNDAFIAESWDGIIGVYDLHGEHISSISSSIPVSERLTSLACDLYSPILSATATDGTLRLFDIRTPNHTRIECINAHSESCLSAQFAEQGKTLVTSGFDKVVKVWDTKMMKSPKATYKVYYPSKISMSVNDKFLVQSEDKSFIIIDPNGLRHGKLKIGTDIIQREHLRLQVCSSFSKDESVLYTAGLGRHVVAWNQLITI